MKHHPGIMIISTVTAFSVAEYYTMPKWLLAGLLAWVISDILHGINNQ